MSSSPFDPESGAGIDPQSGMQPPLDAGSGSGMTERDYNGDDHSASSPDSIRNPAQPLGAGGGKMDRTENFGS